MAAKMGENIGMEVLDAKHSGTSAAQGEVHAMGR